MQLDFLCLLRCLALTSRWLTTLDFFPKLFLYFIHCNRKRWRKTFLSHWQPICHLYKTYYRYSPFCVSIPKGVDMHYQRYDKYRLGLQLTYAWGIVLLPQICATSALPAWHSTLTVGGESPLVPCSEVLTCFICVLAAAEESCGQHTAIGVTKYSNDLFQWYVNTFKVCVHSLDLRQVCVHSWLRWTGPT